MKYDTSNALGNLDIVIYDDSIVSERVITMEGKPDRKVRSQEAYFEGPYGTLPFALSLEDGQEPYPSGVYLPSARCLGVNQYGGPEFMRFQMEPIRSGDLPKGAKRRKAGGSLVAGVVE